MKCKFEFRPVEKTFSDPIAAVFKPGTPFGREYARGDIVLLHPEISSSKIFLNSNILRDALLDSKEYLEEKLGVKIMDTRAPEKIEKPAETRGKKKQTKDLVVEDPIVEEPVVEETTEEQATNAYLDDKPIETMDELTLEDSIIE